MSPTNDTRLIYMNARLQESVGFANVQRQFVPEFWSSNWECSCHNFLLSVVGQPGRGGTQLFLVGVFQVGFKMYGPGAENGGLWNENLGLESWNFGQNMVEKIFYLFSYSFIHLYLFTFVIWFLHLFVFM